MRIFHRFLAMLTVVVGLSALQANVATASPPCAYGACNLKVAPQSCKRVEVVGAPRVNLRSSNSFKRKDNVIGVTYRNDVFKLKRCTKKGCKIILQTEQGPVGAWIHSNYLSCTRKHRYQQCGLYRVSRPDSHGRHSGSHDHSHGHGHTHDHGHVHQQGQGASRTFTSKNGNFRLTINTPGIAPAPHYHNHEAQSSSVPSYGQLFINFNIAGSLH